MRQRCDVAFNLGTLPESVSLGAIDFVVDYERPKIFWKDPTNKLHCTGLPDGSAVAVSDQTTGPTSGKLTLAFASGTAVASGTPLVRCDVYVPTGSTPMPADFPVITVTQATDSAEAAIDPVPAITVGQVRCGDMTTTTSSTTTSTHPTLTTTTTTLIPEQCRVLFRLETAGGFRRVQFNLDYSKAGGMLADDAEVACHNLTTANLGVDENAGEETASFTFVSLSAFTGPRDLVQCDFIPTHFIAAANKFDVDVIAASDSAGVPIAADGLPAVSASDVVCPSLTTSTTTTTIETTTTTTVTTTTLAPLCGDADGNGEIQASDALAALREAVGLGSPCTLATCDTDDSGAVQASDSLRILRAAVGAEVILDCPS